MVRKEELRQIIEGLKKEVERLNDLLDSVTKRQNTAENCLSEIQRRPFVYAFKQLWIRISGLFN